MSFIFLLTTQPFFLLKPPRYTDMAYTYLHIVLVKMWPLQCPSNMPWSYFLFVAPGPQFHTPIQLLWSPCASKSAWHSLPAPTATCYLLFTAVLVPLSCRESTPQRNPVAYAAFSVWQCANPFSKVAQFLMCRHPNTNLASTTYPTVHGSISGYGSPEVYADVIFCASSIGVMPPCICRFPND